MGCTLCRTNTAAEFSTRPTHGFQGRTLLDPFSPCAFAVKVVSSGGVLDLDLEPREQNCFKSDADRAAEQARERWREREREGEGESQSSKDDERTDLLKQKLTTRICTCAFSSWMCARARVGSNHSCLSDIWTAVSMSPHSTRIHSRHVQ